MKKQFVGEINAGEKLDDIFILSEKSMSQKKDGNNFLNITIIQVSKWILGGLILI